MLTTDENKAAGKSGQRNRSKAQPRNRKSGQPRGAKSDKPQDAETQISAPVAPTDSTPVDTGPVDISEIDATPTDTAAPIDTAPADTPSTAPAAPAASPEPVPVSLQTIAKAYGDYTNKSFEQTRSFFEKLASVRSVDTAFVLQADFAKQTYETFVAESEKIRGLHRELARQRLMNLEGFMTSMTETALLVRTKRN